MRRTLQHTNHKGKYPFPQRKSVQQTQASPLFPSRILDVGCGGNPSCFNATTNERTTYQSDIRRIPADIGIDIRQPDHFFVKKFQIGDARNLEFHDKSFQIGLYSHILEHMSSMLDLAKALKEAKRVCRKVHIWLPSITQSGFTNEDHHLMWIKGIRPFPGLFRLLLLVVYLPLSFRYARWIFKRLIKRFDINEERHLILDMDKLRIKDLRIIFQGKRGER